MDFSGFFKSLVIDSWYKVFVYLGGIILLISFFVEVKGISNSQLQLLSGGCFFLGMGEWKNHTTISWIKPPNVYTGGAMLLEKVIWRPTLIGIVFDLVGFYLLYLGVKSLF